MRYGREHLMNKANIVDRAIIVSIIGVCLLAVVMSAMFCLNIIHEIKEAPNINFIWTERGPGIEWRMNEGVNKSTGGKL